MYPFKNVHFRKYVLKYTDVFFEFVCPYQAGLKRTASLWGPERSSTNNIIHLFIFKSLAGFSEEQINNSQSRLCVSRGTVCQVATYPVHLQVLKLQTKIIDLNEIDPPEHFREKSLPISFWLQERGKTRHSIKTFIWKKKYSYYFI